MPSLQRIYVTMCRLRQSLGFGVHSPYIYALQTDVFRERRPYYAYRAIDRLSGPRHARVNKLLFRLVNHLHPACIVEVGPDMGGSLQCMSMARAQTCLRSVRECAGQFSTAMLKQALPPGVPLDFLYVTHPCAYAEVYEAALPLAGPHSVFVFKGIHASRSGQPGGGPWRRTPRGRESRLTFMMWDWCFSTAAVPVETIG